MKKVYKYTACFKDEVQMITYLPNVGLQGSPGLLDTVEQLQVLFFPILHANLGN